MPLFRGVIRVHRRVTAALGRGRCRGIVGLTHGRCRVVLALACLLDRFLGACLELTEVCWGATLAQQIPPDRLSRIASYDQFGGLALTPLGGSAWPARWARLSALPPY